MTPPLLLRSGPTTTSTIRKKYTVVRVPVLNCHRQPPPPPLLRQCCCRRRRWWIFWYSQGTILLLLLLTCARMLVLVRRKNHSLYPYYDYYYYSAMKIVDDDDHHPAMPTTTTTTTTTTVATGAVDTAVPRLAIVPIVLDNDHYDRRQGVNNNNNNNNSDDTGTTMVLPPPLVSLMDNVLLDEQRTTNPDHGGLILDPVRIGAPRTMIDRNDELEQLSREVDQHYTDMDHAAAVGDDTSHWYESFDDLNYDPSQQQSPCRHLSWSYRIHPTCNTFHEHIVLHASPSQPLQRFDIQFLDAGGFREARLLVPIPPNTPATRTTTSGVGDGGMGGGPETTTSTTTAVAAAVLKTLLYEREVSKRSSVRDVQKEAHLFDRLQSTGLFSSIYGHCGTSVLVEKGAEIYQDIIPEDTAYVTQPELFALQEKKKKQNRSKWSMNDLSDPQKVTIALAMAQSLATLHDLGVVHSDVTVYQWLRSDHHDKDDHQHQRIILNDINSAEIQQWNDITLQYCPYWAQYDWGRYKAPEEYVGGYLDASVDVWAMGNLLYGLLTGLPPYHHISKIRKVHKAVQQGPPPMDVRYLTNGTVIESHLYQIMQECFQMDPHQRISMQEVVQSLHRLAETVAR